jgi:transposase-like protein
MARRKHRAYTSEQRQAVLATVRAKGVSVAAKEHGVAQSCVSRWAASAGVKRGGEAETSSKAPTETAQRTSRPRVAKSYTPSQKAEVLEHASAQGETAAAAKSGISRFSIYDWQRR